MGDSRRNPRAGQVSRRLVAPPRKAPGHPLSARGSYLRGARARAPCVLPATSARGSRPVVTRRGVGRPQLPAAPRSRPEEPRDRAGLQNGQPVRLWCDARPLRISHRSQYRERMPLLRASFGSFRARRGWPCRLSRLARHGFGLPRIVPWVEQTFKIQILRHDFRVLFQNVRSGRFCHAPRWRPHRAAHARGGARSCQPAPC